MLKSLGTLGGFFPLTVKHWDRAQRGDGTFILGDFQLSATQGFGQHDLNSILAQF